MSSPPPVRAAAEAETPAPPSARLTVQIPPPPGDDPPLQPEPRSVDDLPLTLAELERWAVQRALRDTDGRLTEAAKTLGIGRTTLYRKIEKYRLR